MKKGSLTIVLIIVILIAGYFSIKFEPESEKKDVSQKETSASRYLEKVDTNYSFDLTKKLTTYKSNEKLGYRPAGSKAEFEAGEMLTEEFKKIGLKNVTKDEVAVDSWEFEKADLTYFDQNNERHELVLGGYQANFVTDGPEEFEVVYAGKGTKQDLEGLDVKGKLVLIDINQRDEWWINYPAYQASLKGAKAVLAAQKGGYGEIDPEALNAQDLCGPDDTPAFSISRKDADGLLALMKETKQENLRVTFDAVSIVEKDAKSYNIVGEIPGKDKDSIILLSAHYDAYFDGFQDDSAAIGLLAGIAKGLIDSDYKPEKTIVFVAQAAEEWGIENSRYDWSTGAYGQIFEARPEWQKQVVANINFELPAYEHTSADEIRSVYELNPFLTELSKEVPKVDGVYKDGISVVSPLRTWSDDFSYSLGGIPALRNDFQDSDFMKTHYHSQFDNESTYNEKAFEFHHNLYGLLVQAYDQTAVMPLDFTERFKAMKETINKDVNASAGIDTTELKASLDKVIATAEELTKQVNKINADYKAALVDGDKSKAKELLSQNKNFNDKLREIFRYSQDHFVNLTWEDEPLFPHEHAQNNLDALSRALGALQSGDVNAALDDDLLLVDNNWYAYHFDRETFDFFTNQVKNQGADRLSWGNGKIIGHEDLYDVINSLQSKSDTKDPKVDAEIQALKNAEENQKALLKQTIDKEVSDVQALEEKLNAIVE
ncbi:M28 family peptidase [Peribacillus loiseleuriae]|uniref:M28 family peptidase n=1 Tax=Peribacillus loiseleuriae TaxID=1679170 RepID=UPI003D003002